MGQSNRLTGPAKRVGTCHLWEAILTASVLRQGSSLVLLGCFWPRIAFRMKTGKAPATSSSGSPTQCWPPSKSWDSYRGDPRTILDNLDGCSGGGGQWW